MKQRYHMILKIRTYFLSILHLFPTVYFLKSLYCDNLHIDLTPSGYHRGEEHYRNIVLLHNYNPVFGIGFEGS